MTGWSAEVITGSYHYNVSGKGNWYSRIKYSIGRVAGTRDVAIRAVLQGVKETGWSAQPCNATPSVYVDGAWRDGTSVTKNVNSNDWSSSSAVLGTQYAIITGLANGATVTCRNARGGTTVSVTNPITAPAFRAKVSGAWKEATAVYVKVSGSWREASAGYAKSSGTWKEIQ